MRGKDLTELRNLGVAELEQRLGEARQEMFNLRLRLATRQLTNHRELPRVRRRVARLLTVIRERQLAEEYATLREPED